MPSTPISTNSHSQGLALDFSDIALTAVKNAAQTAPDPLLRDTAELALSITQEIQVSILLCGPFQVRFS
jgi:hypothetical protein